MKKELICISCPQGCRLSAEIEGDNFSVSGNRCPRGAVYARQEMTDPRRVVTAVMRTDDPDNPFIPVRTAKPYPKDEIPALLNKLYSMTVKTPIKRGDVIIDGIVACATSTPTVP